MKQCIEWIDSAKTHAVVAESGLRMKHAMKRIDAGAANSGSFRAGSTLSRHAAPSPAKQAWSLQVPN